MQYNWWHITHLYTIQKYFKFYSFPIKLINNINLNKFDLKKVSFGDSGILGRGGMKTKLKAAKDYLNEDSKVWILNGNQKDVIEKAIQRKKLGTKIYLA